MNFNAYDAVNPVFSTWVVPRNQKLYSYTLPKYGHFTLLKRYDVSTGSYDFYIALSDNLTKDKIWYRTYLTNSKALTINLSSIWDISNFRFMTAPQEISIDEDAKFDDGVVYKINF